MTVISANDLKIRGVSAIERVIKDEHQVMISVRGKERFVVLDIEAYNRFREAELESAMAEVRADVAAGQIHKDSVTQHIRRIRREP